VLKPGGQVFVNFTKRNRFGKLPSSGDLERLGLRVVRDGPLDPRFSDLTFRFSDGTEFPEGAELLTTVLEKIAQ
jgi:filamentous hemagglutinin